MSFRFPVATLAIASIIGAASVAQAQSVPVQVTVQNLAPANSISFAALRLGFHNGTFDSFNTGQVATQPIISIAEGGTGVDWFPAFAAAEPNANLGSVLRSPLGSLRPGETASAVITVNPLVNRFFTFGSMVVPSNDHWIGNDNPQQYLLFNPAGQLNFNTISQFGRQVWDNGSELEVPANAAFLVGSVNANRTPENGVVNFNFDKLDTFNGLTTTAGYVFQRQFGANDEIYRISFAIVPEPTTLAAIAGVGLVALRRRR